jgi:ACS family D-galactonate transporter-like MFS transporter
MGTSTIGRPPRAGTRAGATQHFMLALVVGAMMINYLDRSNLSVAAPLITKEFGLGPVQMGVLFSAFAWTYAFANLPTGYLMDWFGTRVVYGIALLGWSVATALQSLCSGINTLLPLRLAVGTLEAPAIPSSARVVAVWFPPEERGLATSVYIMAQSVGTAFLSPLLFWIAVSMGWRWLFFICGVFGIVWGVVWCLFYPDPRPDQLPLAEPAETNLQRRGKVSWSQIGQLLMQRQLLGLCLGKFFVSTTVWFFLTWFPTYLVRERGMTMLQTGFLVVVPAIAMFVGTFSSGLCSDWLLRRGASLDLARKLPISAGAALVSLIALANLTNSIELAMIIVAVACFMQGLGSISWVLASDIAPAGMIGTMSGIGNFVGGISGIITPIIVGFIIRETGSFAWALVFVGGMSLMAAVSFTFIMGPLKRMVIA